MLSRFTFVFFLFVTGINNSFANQSEADDFDLTLSSDTAITITRFGDKGDRILWIPSEYGVNKKRHSELAGTLSNLHHEVWLAELHESYFIPPGRSSYTEIPVDDISELIQESIPDDKRKLFIVTTARGAVLSLLAINKWLSRTGGSEHFGGIVLIHPNFQATTPIPGTALEFLPIVDSTQLPVFIIQPKNSNKYWYLQELVTRLTDSGSKVYSQVIEQASDGYHVRPDATETEKQVARKLPKQISGAVRLLAKTEVAVTEADGTMNTPWKVRSLSGSLQPYPEDKVTPVLELQDMDGDIHVLEDYHGKVVLINFWATWCPPCVEEIPSLGRLQNNFSESDLVVLSVDIGEQKADIESFLEQVPADFPVLVDTEGITVKPWKIIAFPTTFVLDQQGKITLAYFGGLQWDSPDVIIQLQSLVSRTESK